jgi:hypothetical protein
MDQDPVDPLLFGLLNPKIHKFWITEQGPVKVPDPEPYYSKKLRKSSKFFHF